MNHDDSQAPMRQATANRVRVGYEPAHPTRHAGRHLAFPVQRAHAALRRIR